MPDGSAGAMVPIETSMPLNRPDGLRTVGPQTLIQAEGQGRVTELTVKGNRAEVRVLQEGLTAAVRSHRRWRHRLCSHRAGQSRCGAISPVGAARARPFALHRSPASPKCRFANARPEPVFK